MNDRHQSTPAAVPVATAAQQKPANTQQHFDFGTYEFDSASFDHALAAQFLDRFTTPRAALVLRRTLAVLVQHARRYIDRYSPHQCEILADAIECLDGRDPLALLDDADRSDPSGGLERAIDRYTEHLRMEYLSERRSTLNRPGGYTQAQARLQQQLDDVQEQLQQLRAILPDDPSGDPQDAAERARDDLAFAVVEYWQAWSVFDNPPAAGLSIGEAAQDVVDARRALFESLAAAFRSGALRSMGGELGC